MQQILKVLDIKNVQFFIGIMSSLKAIKSYLNGHMGLVARKPVFGVSDQD